MANKVKIYSDLKSGKVQFDGSRVRNKEIGSLEVEAHPTLSNRIRIKSNTVFKRGSDTNYRVFFGRLNINRIQNKEGQDLVADLGMDRDAVIAYILVQIKKPIVTEYFEYNPITDRLEANKNIEVKKHGFYIGGKYKMASGNSNLYYEDLATRGNQYPVMGEVFDQSLPENQVAGAGTSTPKMRVFGDYQEIPLGGSPVNDTAIGYDGDNFFPFNISGVGITTRVAEAVAATQTLKYEIIVNDISVYIQYLEHDGLAVNEDITWYFDHPLDIEAGTTLKATVYKVSTVNNQEVNDGVLQVCEGSSVPTRYATTVLNRFFEDRDLELISPYVHYQAMDFGLDSTGSTILLRDLSLGADSLLQPHAVNTLEAIAEGTTIKIKTKGGAKVIAESLPVNAVSIDGVFVNSVLNQAVVQLNAIFTNTAGFASADTFVDSFTLSGNDLTLGLNDGVSYTVDVTTLGVDANNFVSSGSLSGSDLTLTMADASVVTIDVTSLGLDENTTVSSGAVSGTDIILTMSDGSTVTVDASTLGGSSSSGNPVVSGSVIGTDLVLVLDDATQITIDASNMINGSSGLASNNGWYISYGANANDAVGTSVNDSTINQQLPFYFGQALERGAEYKWNFQSNGGSNLIMGIWDGAEAAIAYNGGASTASNWGTSFTYAGGFIAGSNSTLLTTNSGAKYVVANGDAMSIRFGNDGHLTLVDLSGANEVAVAKTTIPLAVTSFNMQMYTWANGVLPNGIISNSDFLWDIKHDYANTEDGVLNGVLTHTVLERTLALSVGEQYMIPLDKQGAGETFGLDYTGAATGVVTAEDDLTTSFKYQTNESIIADINWAHNTAASGFFTAGGGSIDSYRVGGAGTEMGLVSLRYMTDNTLELWSETNNELIATSVVHPDGSDINLHFGVNGNTNYSDLPVITKQTIGQGSQPDVNFAPVVANQTASVTEGEVLNFQIVSSDNIVNQFAELDAPSWMTLNQNSGVLSGTAPAYLGTAADTIVVNCKAGNAIGGTVEFTVTVTVAQVAYTNSKSLNLNGSSNWLQGNPVNLTALERATNGDGNAWTISMWVKPNNNTSNQTLLVYGAGDDYNGGAITVKQSGGTSLVLNYGTVYNNIILVAGNSFVANTWQHVMITFDGGTTGVDSNLSTDYYSRFNIYIDGVLKTPVGVASNNGYDGVISGANPSDNIFRIGRASNVHNNYFGGIINQVAIWDTDQTANVSTIYNSGATQNLSSLTTAPTNYYEIETSVTTITDIEGSANLTGYNFSNTDLVTDTP